MTSSNRGPRVAPIELGKEKALAKIEAQILAARGSIPLLYRVLLNSVPIAQGWKQMLTAVRNRSSLPATLRELIILRVGVLNRASYEFEMHRPYAEKAGVPPQKIEALREPVLSQLFTQVERTVLACADAMTRTIEVSDEQFEPLRQHFNAQEIVELVATIAAYNMVTRFLVAMNIVDTST